MSFCDHRDFLPDNWPVIAGHDFRGHAWTCLNCGVAYTYMTKSCPDVTVKEASTTETDWSNVNRRFSGS